MCGPGEMGFHPRRLRWVTVMVLAGLLGVDRVVDRRSWNSQRGVCLFSIRTRHRCWSSARGVPERGSLNPLVQGSAPWRPTFSDQGSRPPCAQRRGPLGCSSATSRHEDAADPARAMMAGPVDGAGQMGGPGCPRSIATASPPMPLDHASPKPHSLREPRHNWHTPSRVSCRRPLLTIVTSGCSRAPQTRHPHGGEAHAVASTGHQRVAGAPEPARTPGRSGVTA